MSQENHTAYDIVINNARVFDGSAVLEGLSSVGITGNKISFVG
jgi:N-acyl-D-aspartate/D-glutamate deacylase